MNFNYKYQTANLNADRQDMNKEVSSLPLIVLPNDICSLFVLFYVKEKAKSQTSVVNRHIPFIFIIIF